MIEISVIDPARLAQSPLTKAWKGSRDHIGPVQTVTPLVDMLSGKTTCGTLALLSGTLTWGAARLKPFMDAGFLDELAEALFVWQFDWRLVDPNVAPTGKPPEQPVTDSAAMTLRSFTRKAILGEDQWTSFYQPTMELFHVSNVVNFLLEEPDRAAYSNWLKTISARLDDLAPAPELEVPVFEDFENEAAYNAYTAPRRGMPLPPYVLDPARACSPDTLSRDASAWLATVNPRKNRYLRSPQDLAELGYEGPAYGSQ